MEYLLRDCSKCFEEKLLEDFERERNQCKSCRAKFLNQYRKERKAVDLSFKKSENLTIHLSNCLKNKQKKSKLEKYLDCSLDVLYKWVEFQFDEEMTWDNYGSYWQIDHILPRSHFDHLNEEELMLCWNWRNLRPVTRAENMEKGSKVDYQLYYQNVSLAAEFLDVDDFLKSHNSYKIIMGFCDPYVLDSRSMRCLTRILNFTVGGTVCLYFQLVCR